MMNRQAFDALAALCGNSSPPGPPTAAAAGSNAPVNHALIAQLLSLRNAQASARQASPSQLQQVPTPTDAQASQQQQALQTALAHIPSNALQAYLSSTVSSTAPPHTSPYDYTSGIAGLHLAGIPGVNTSIQAVLAAKILMNQQQQQQAQHQGPSSSSLTQSAAAPASTPQSMEVDSAPVAMRPPPAHSVSVSMSSGSSHGSNSPSLSAATTPAPSVNRAPPPMKEAHSAAPLPARCGLRANEAKPPAKKRAARSEKRSPTAGGRGGALKKSPPLKSKNDVMSEREKKKEAKRSANRLSAHLSRERQKMLLEDLTADNLMLRRKELILQAIPDLIIAFDSNGIMSFVSHSVKQFLSSTREELLNTSFWDLLTQDSSLMMKIAFADASLKEKSGEPGLLWDGETVTVMIVDKKANGDNETYDCEPLSLRGVVHFSGESPECVCSMRHE